MKNIDEIISDLQRGTLCESSSVEIKRDLPHDPLQIAKTVVGLANLQGGYLIIGGREKANGIEWVGVEDASILSDKLSQIINDFTIGVIANLFMQNISHADIVLLQIEKSTGLAYYSRRLTSPERITAYVRKGGTVIKGKEDILDKKAYKNVFKYMTIEAFLISLYNKTWRFYEPKKWSDKFERRFYCAEYQLPNSDEKTPLLYATCVTRAKSSEAAWKVYSHGQGLSSHCVQLELDVVELRRELRKSGMRVDEKYVVYKNENYILDLHKRKSASYQYYFTNFSYENFLSLLTLKRDAYSYEQEVRFFACPKEYQPRNLGRKCEYYDMPMEWNKVIKKVRIDHSCSDAELVSIQQACFSVGINPIIKNYSFVGNLIKPNDCRDIEFEKFDIDAMPGKQRITIR